MAAAQMFIMLPHLVDIGDPGRAAERRAVRAEPDRGSQGKYIDGGCTFVARGVLV